MHDGRTFLAERACIVSKHPTMNLVIECTEKEKSLVKKHDITVLRPITKQIYTQINDILWILFIRRSVQSHNN